MDKLRAIAIFATLLLVACSGPASGQCYEPGPDSHVVCDKQNKYSFFYPAWIEEGTEIQKKVEVYTYDFSQCPDSLGITNANKKIENSAFPAQWGKVDYPFDYSATELKPDCRPYPPLEASYAFCAEKDGKAVVICVQQMTDDPELAEQVFSTFRWLD